MEKVKVYLEDVDCSAIAMTSDLGACSLMNEPFLLKSKEKTVELTEEQIKILKEIGEYELITKKEGKNIMDENVIKELKNENTILKEKLAQFEKEMIEKELNKFNFDKELKKELSDLFISFDENAKDVILKAFNSFTVEENNMQKLLTEEAGNEGESEVVEKDLNTRIKEARENK
jgi:hypothetical protein